jgi:saccharopepsin
LALTIGLARLNLDRSSIPEPIAAQNNVSDSVFSFYLTDKNYGSEIVFGGIDKSKYYGDITWYPVFNWESTFSKWSRLHKLTSKLNNFLPDVYWSINLDKASFGNMELASNGIAVFDSAYRFIGVPTEVYDKIQDVVGYSVDLFDKQLTLFDCSAINRLPVFSLVFNRFSRKEFTLTPKEYVVGEHQGLCAHVFTSTRAMNEYVPNLWVFGTVFMKKYYTVFDEKRGIGLATAA